LQRTGQGTDERLVVAGGESDLAARTIIVLCQRRLLVAELGKPGGIGAESTMRIKGADDHIGAATPRLQRTLDLDAVAVADLVAASRQLETKLETEAVQWIVIADDAVVGQRPDIANAGEIPVIEKCIDDTKFLTAGGEGASDERTQCADGEGARPAILKNIHG